MPTEAVEKPVEDTKPEDASGSGTESDSDDDVPELEDGDLQQQSQVWSNISPFTPINICLLMNVKIGYQRLICNLLYIILQVAAAAGIPEELVSKAKQSRSEKKARKAMSKLGKACVNQAKYVQHVQSRKAMCKLSKACVNQAKHVHYRKAMSKLGIGKALFVNQAKHVQHVQSR